MSGTHMNLRTRITLGRTGCEVSRIGIAASYGVGGDTVERAYDGYGVNYLYWGSMRRDSFGEGIRRLARRNREDLFIVIQSYARFGSLLRPSVERALRQLRLERADMLLLGMYNAPPSKRVMDAAWRLRDSGRVRFLAVSAHKRTTFQQYIKDGVFDVLMFRYNAAHRGAENDILPFVRIPNRPGTVSYTATRWGSLLNPRKVPKGERIPRASDCYRFVLSRPGIDICLTGPKNEEQMREALAALDRGPMTEEELDWMRRVGDHIHG
jgi:aryl-alcohol dehydrogenase-like predicted oxidoreductase